MESHNAGILVVLRFTLKAVEAVYIRVNLIKFTYTKILPIFIVCPPDALICLADAVGISVAFCNAIVLHTLCDRAGDPAEMEEIFDE